MLQTKETIQHFETELTLTLTLKTILPQLNETKETTGWIYPEQPHRVIEYKSFPYEAAHIQRNSLVI